jgi:hypothetical protein
MNLLPLITWIESTAMGTAIRESTWLFPFIEAGHLLALSLMGGAVLIVDLRMMGWGMRRLSASQISRDVHPWLVGSLLGLIVTGVLLFMSEATKCYFNPAFWVKMGFLVAGTLYTFTVRQRVALAGGAEVDPARARLVAIGSVCLWSGVGIAGRAIGFY